MIELALFVLAYFKDDTCKAAHLPSRSQMLFRQIGTIVLAVGMGEELQNFLEPNLTLQIAPQPLTLSPDQIENEPSEV